MKSVHRTVLVVSTILASWLGLQMVHELGHVLGAWFTGGRIERVVLDPRMISRTDLSDNPRPLIVAWAGPIVGVVLPLLLWGAAAWLRMPGAFVVRFFAGFCLVANGAYIAGGSFGGIGDSGEMIRHGSPLWALWLFGLVTMPLGLRLWHRQGAWFGFGAGRRAIEPRVAYGTLAVLVALGVFGLIFGAR